MTVESFKDNKVLKKSALLLKCGNIKDGKVPADSRDKNSISQEFVQFRSLLKIVY